MTVSEIGDDIIDTIVDDIMDAWILLIRKYQAIRRLYCIVVYDAVLVALIVYDGILAASIDGGRYNTVLAVSIVHDGNRYDLQYTSLQRLSYTR